MTILQHKEKLYAIWSGWIKQEATDATPQHLYLSEMENPYTLKGKRVKLSSLVENWETGGPLNLNEGPEVLKTGKKILSFIRAVNHWKSRHPSSPSSIRPSHPSHPGLPLEPFDPSTLRQASGESRLRDSNIRK